MAAAAAALLDELMGRNRNAAPNEKGIELNWEDPEYCKYFLVSFCPHDLFVNTRADLGPCAKVHDDEVKKLFDVANNNKKYQYLEDFIRFCNSILNDVQRKIEKGRQRLALMNNSEKVAVSPAQAQRNQEQMALLTEKINKLVEEAEAAGIQGNVEQAQGLMKLCDQLKEERSTLKENSHWQQTATLAAEQEKQMEVCEVCGAFLIVGDAQQRIDDHLMGKQHVGYAKLKAAVEEMTKERDRIKEERERRREIDKREKYIRREAKRRANAAANANSNANTNSSAGASASTSSSTNTSGERDRRGDKYENRRYDHRRDDDRFRFDRGRDRRDRDRFWDRDRDDDRDRSRIRNHRERRRGRRRKRSKQNREYKQSRNRHEDGSSKESLRKLKDTNKEHLNGDKHIDKYQ